MDIVNTDKVGETLFVLQAVSRARLYIFKDWKRLFRISTAFLINRIRKSGRIVYNYVGHLHCRFNYTSVYLAVLVNSSQTSDVSETFKSTRLEKGRAQKR